MLQQLKKYINAAPRAAILAGLSAAILMGAQAQAVTPSPQMIEQFKQLPKAEQERLARQYGIDPASITGSAVKSTTVENPSVVTPRVATNNVIDQSEDDKLNQATKTEAKVEAIEAKKEDQLTRFGYDLFAGSPSTFAPVSDVPVPAEYMMGPGDALNVQLFGKENSQFALTVGRDGAVQFPNIGPISLVGLSFAETRELLQQKISQSMIGIEANITMGELRSIRIFVAGDAYKPGSYTVSSLSTITQALFISGGVNQIGSLRDIQLKRAGKTVGRLDLYDLLLRGDASGDIRLQSGDVVFIPSSGGTVSVMGEVRRPAIYELKNNETMADVIRMASGLNPGAYPKASTIERYSRESVKTVISVDLTEGTGLNTLAKNGDLLNVRSASSRIDNAITITGAVIRPGKYQWTSGITVADLLPSIWGDLTIAADLDYSLLVREINQRGDIEVERINLGRAIAEPHSHFNLSLKPRDSVIVFDYA
ncbi:MAG: SLBB domain-containing protein, partial [Shewanella sp.]